MSAFTHGGDIYGAARALGNLTRQMLDFSANINPLGLPSELRESFITSLGSLEHYPDPQCLDARQALAMHHKCSVDELTLGNGAAEIFQLICLGLKPQRVVSCEPTYSGYGFSAQLYGIPYVPILHGLKKVPPIAEIAKTLRPNDCLFICSPNNPTGHTLTSTEMSELVEVSSSSRAYLVVDESFMDFLPLHKVPRLEPLPEHVVIVRSLTKILALPGLRLGYAKSSSSIAFKLRSVRDPWSVNALALIAAQQYPQLGDYLETTREFVAAENYNLRTALSEHTALKPVSGDVNFLLVDVAATGLTSSELCSRMQTRGILLRNCNTFAYLCERYVRVAVRTHNENQRLVEALRETT